MSFVFLRISAQWQLISMLSLHWITSVHKAKRSLSWSQHTASQTMSNQPLRSRVIKLYKTVGFLVSFPYAVILIVSKQFQWHSLVAIQFYSCNTWAETIPAVRNYFGSVAMMHSWRTARKRSRSRLKSWCCRASFMSRSWKHCTQYENIEPWRIDTTMMVRHRKIDFQPRGM